MTDKWVWTKTKKHWVEFCCAMVDWHLGGNKEMAHAWWRTPNERLGGRVPKEVLSADRDELIQFLKNARTGIL